LVKNLILVKQIDDCKAIKSNDDIETIIISFTTETDKFLTEQKIKHQLADEYLTDMDREKLFDQAISLHSWYKKNQGLSELEFEQINLLSMMDTIEFHLFLMTELINFLIIKKILEKNQPAQIITNKNFFQIIDLLIDNKRINVIFTDSKLKTNLYWDKISIKYNIGRYPISFNISRQTYFKIKNFVEQFVCTMFGLWYNFKKADKETILLLEFYPPLYQNLLNELKKYGNNVIIINRRRSAVSDYDSIKILRKTNSKLLNFKKILKNSKISEIEAISDTYYAKLEKLLKNNENFENQFSIEGKTFWPIIKKRLMQIYKQRLRDYIYLIISAKNIMQKLHVKCILSLNEVGETEKTFLNVNKNKTTSVLLEHGFVLFFPESSKYDVLSSYSNFRDKIAVWGDYQKKYLIEQRSINPNRIFVTGSPRHDSFFNSQLEKKSGLVRTILIAPTPITHLRGHDEIGVHKKYQETIQKLCLILKKFNVNIVVKIHPSQAQHNNEIREIVSKIDSKIPVILFRPVIELIISSDAVITITPEGFAPSTIILESLILKKPTMNITLDDNFYEFEYIKNSSVKAIFVDDNFEDNLKNFLLNQEYSNTLINNGDEFIKKFLSNPGTASKSLASILNSF